MGVVLVLTVGCGRLGFDSNESGVTDAAVPVDAASQPMLRFEQPVAVDEIEPDMAIDIDDPTLTADQLELLFNRASDSNDIFVSTRVAIGDPWSTPVLSAELSSGGLDATPKLSPDGLSVIIGTTRGPAGDQDLYIANRPSREGPWSTPVEIAELNTEDDEFSGTIAPDDLHMYFSRRDNTTSLTTIFETRRDTSDSPWNTPMPLEFGVDSATDAHEIDVGTIVLAVRTANSGVDLALAFRPNPDAPFEIVQYLDDVNTDSAETDPWLTADGNVLYFTSSVSGVQRIYRAARIRPDGL